VSLIGRIIVMILALLLAAVATSIVMSFALLTFALQQLSPDPTENIMVWGATLFGAGAAAFSAFLPTLIALALAEALSVRSALAYALGGAAIMLLAYYGAGLGWSYEESIDRAPPLITRQAEIAVAAGAVFGLVYWMIAGRRAGLWRKPLPSS
jgi:hypothetical protein